MRRLICVCFLLTTILFPTIASAWNDTGHMTVALIAYRQLSDHQKQQIADLLKQHPHYQLYLSADAPAGVSVDEWAFLRAATWPDFVRPSRPGDDQFKNASITHFHNGPWHYVNIPYVADPKKSHLDPTTLPTRDEPNAISGFIDEMKLLQSADAKPEDKAVALAWVEHLVGDIHQPMHACSMYSVDHVQGDKGGNDDAIRVDGYVMRLHQFWDEQLGTSPDYLALKFIADDIATDTNCDVSRLPQYKSDTTFTSWADESFAAAVAFVYLDGRLRTAPWPDFQSHKIAPDEVPAIPPSYGANAHEFSKQRVSLAGHRLADQLKAVFKD